MGEILDFPRDTLRYRYFVRESNIHQAKLEIQTFEWLVNKYTKVGDTILDPMSGIGTVHYAATMGRNTIAIEISPEFCALQWENIQNLTEVLGIPNGVDCQVLEGDCRRFLPLGHTEATQPAACIFSPPYGDLWAKSDAPKSKFAEEKHINIGYDLQDANVGNIKTYPLYLIAMREIYKLVNRSLPMGGILISICKDYVKAGKRVYVSKDNVAKMIEAGFQMEDWHFRYTDPKIFQIQARKLREEKGTSKAELDIDFEDLLVMRKIEEV